MKSSSSKNKNSFPIKTSLGLFILAFFGAILFFFEHFNEEPLDVGKVRVEKNFNVEKPDVGYLAPRFVLRNLDGNREDLKNYRGQVVVLNFWATWCAPCRVEMPAFESLYRRYRSEGMTVLAISIDKGEKEKVRAFIEDHQLSFPVLLDTEGKVERLYPSNTIPFTYVIDRSGYVVARVDGAKNWESEETFEAVEYLLNQS